jgi:hypothetical protein
VTSSVANTRHGLNEEAPLQGEDGADEVHYENFSDAESPPEDGNNEKNHWERQTRRAEEDAIRDHCFWYIATS